jgi:hypothetical protein
MTEKRSPALDTAMAYHQAWTGHDFDRAMTFIAEDIVCDAPAGRIEGGEAFRAFMEPFSRILTGSSLIATFGDKQTALLMYDAVTLRSNTPSVPNATPCMTARSSTSGLCLTERRSKLHDAPRQPNKHADERRDVGCGAPVSAAGGRPPMAWETRADAGTLSANRSLGVDPGKGTPTEIVASFRRRSAAAVRARADRQ